MRPENRPITYIFVLQGNPHIEFVAQSEKPNLVISAIDFTSIQKSILKYQTIFDQMNATRVQYLMNDSGEWEFNYLLTKTGSVIGTERAYLRRARKIELIVQEAGKINEENN
jgi:hypothetical protein